MTRRSGAHPGSTKGLTIMTLPITGLALALSVSLAAGVATQAAAQPTPLLPPTIGNSATDAASVATAPDADARAFLLSASSAIERGRMAEAREALERAETRLLVLATPPLAPGEAADSRQSIQLIVTARRSLTLNDRPAALRAIDGALESTDVAARPQPLSPLAIAAPAPPTPHVISASPVPDITRALQAGHWALDGAAWKWVPPETVLRPVQTAPRVAGQYVWRDQRYVWVPAHYAD
jgi:hypothetical protein